MNKQYLSKVDLLKVMKTGNSTRLFNALQNYYYTLFIDVRDSNKFQKEHIINTMNIPLERFKSPHTFPTKKQLAALIKNHKTKNYMIINMYFFTDNIENKAFWDCLSFLQETIMDFELCRHSKLTVITDHFEIFAKQYPFLLTNYELQNQSSSNNAVANNYLSMTSLPVHATDRGYPNIIIQNALFLGDFFHATTRKTFVDLGISHVVNCSPPKCIPCKFENDDDLNVTYVRVPVYDMYDQDIKQYFDQTAQFIHDALSQNATGMQSDDSKCDDECKGKKLNKVLIHCQAGISRSSTITISYLMKYKHIKYENALQYVHERRPIITPNSSFVKQLKEYEKSIFNIDDTRDYKVQERNWLTLPAKTGKNINVRPPPFNSQDK